MLGGIIRRISITSSPFSLPSISLPWLFVGSTQPQTTSIYNDYIVNLPLHARVGGCTVG